MPDGNVVSRQGDETIVSSSREAVRYQLRVSRKVLERGREAGNDRETILGYGTIDAENSSGWNGA
jgi:hypothetical protein